ncbi:hypothetical protein EOJ36_09930 [Sandaracinomonas limnophila]|uniref:Ig-like domain-containing protein n=1 Tax=Sandaracinomonas limnophila TaxID=1862386 RepID=A0A437PPZ6_9BACT|nr:gliding motility-associated C-terminal domain-containing protein [Sandaracinomonas limnophila]RVU24229.1 hypothetical protein EOJ36_09930 [Sandaracinomonas limnophila]
MVRLKTTKFFRGRLYLLLILFFPFFAEVKADVSWSFNTLYGGTGTSYTRSTNTISGITPITGSNFKFTQTGVTQFTGGNSVEGILSYIDGSNNLQSLYVSLDRRDKTSGPAPNSLSFYGVSFTSSSYATLTGNSFLLVVAGKESNYNTADNVPTSSDPIDNALNDLINLAPSISITSSLSAFSTCQGTASASQSFTVSGAHLSANLVVTAPTGYEVSWSSGSGYGSSISVSPTSGTVSSRSVYVRLKGTSAGAISGNVVVSSTGASTTNIAVSGTVTASPTITSSAGASRTGTGTVDLTATASAGTLYWYATSSSTTALGATGSPWTTPTISNTTTYYVEAQSAGCKSTRTAVIATVSGSATISLSESLTGFTACQSTASASQSFTVSGSTLTANMVLTAPTGFEISTDNSTFQSTLTLNQSGGAVASTTIYVRMASLSASPTTADLTITSTGAADQTITLSGTVTPTPTITGVTNDSRCGDGTVNLGASVSAGVVKWYATETSVTVLSTGTTYSPSITGTTTFWVEALDGTCISTSRTSVTATKNAVPTISGTNPGSVCGNGTVTLSATVSSGSAKWYDASTGGTLLATGSTYSPSITATTSYWVEALDGSCTSASRTEVIATKKSVPTVTVSPASTTSYPGQSVTLTASGASTYAWSPSTELSATTGASVIASPTASRVYTVTGTAANGCTATATASITFNDDTDGDGVPDAQEILDGTDPNDPCSYKPASQVIANVTTAWQNLDCDGDGTPNSTDPEPLNFCVGGTGVIPALGSDAYNNFFKNGDCDGDGISNHMETNTSGLPLDFDGDGVPNYLDGDSDNDGIPDAVEKNRDSDGDGWADYQDLDSDNDGIADKVEAGPAPTNPIDSDGDGIQDYLDLDSDADGISDAAEAIDVFAANRDDNFDGRIDKKGVFIDANNNGWADISEGDSPVDTENDKIPDYLDLDSDDDCIPDYVELTRDIDGDNRPNYRDKDSDGDGIPDMAEAGSCSHPFDTDKDGAPDYLDLDSDNDGIPDSVEKGADGNNPVDTDKDGTPDFRDLDSDNDGIPDTVEKGADGNNPVDTDKDGTPDYRDLDSDNDGIPDTVEKGADGNNPVDTDKDGTPDYRDLDSDNDGIPDTVEKGADGNNPVDTDKDGTPDYRDLDSDNDGIPDKVEKGADGNNPVDTDKDGTPDYRDLDSDNDGIPDTFEKGSDGNNPVDTDKDGTPDYRDLDSENDGIPDSIEKGPNGNSPVDTDNDGTPDFRDLDSDNDTLPDTLEKGPNGNAPLDTDKDGIPDYRELDSDNDGISDKNEDSLDYGNLPDCDNDGIPNRLDADVCEVFTTQGISPNGDGKNDKLIIPGVLSYNNRLTVFNRWGNVVYEQDNYKNNWGGETNNGYRPLEGDGLLPDGTYYYVIDFLGAKPNIGSFIFINRTH